MRLRGCAGWSLTLLFASNKVRVSGIEAHIMLKPRLHGPTSLRACKECQYKTKSLYSKKPRWPVKFLSFKCYNFP